MIPIPNDISEGESSPGLNNDKANYNMTSPLSSYPPPPRTHPKVELTWPPPPPPVTYRNKEVVTLTDAAWSACPNGIPKLHSCYASEYRYKKGIFVAGIYAGMSSFDYKNMTRKQKKSTNQQ